MKLNKILAAFLLAVTLFSSVSVFAPLVASAAGSESTVVDANARVNGDALKALIDEAVKGDKTATEAFVRDSAAGYLDYYAAGNFAICINRYTGVLYYVNTATGQILTSNPTNHGVSGMTAEILMSQIELDVYENADPTKPIDTMYSIYDAARRGQISVSAIKNGLRVNYALGITDNRYLLPAMMTTARFNDVVLKSFVRQVQTVWAANLGVLATDYNGIKYNYQSNDNSKLADGTYNISTVIQYIAAVLPNLMMVNMDSYNMAYDMFSVLGYYSLDKAGKNYVLNPDLSNNILADAASDFRDLVKDYDFETMFADEKEAGYVQPISHIPVVRLALEYTLNADGTLNVSLPANSIIFDESYFTLNYVKVLPYFGAGKRYENKAAAAETAYDGYLFYPDGSGMVLDFADFRTETFKLTKTVYGIDSAYSALSKTTDYRGESITMPVYGIVNEVKVGAGSDATVLNGFLAILEDGASMSDLTYATDANHAFLSVYPTYTPYPKDEYNLSSTLSVSGLSKYTIVSDSRYTGSYNTRIVMLTDPAMKALVDPEQYFEASYVGMANYYRQYLIDGEVLKAMQDLKKDLPLYVEAFGAMDVMGRFLTFPVTKSIPLTTFDDVQTMYKELSDLGVTNVNFRLSGFANGGMNATYPVKSRWERACGGASDFKKLLATSKAQTGDNNLGLYPEFDFMYLNNQANFDGMSMKGNVACMVDNRYASKKVLSSMLTQFTKIRSFVITADALSDLYAKFEKKYGKYDVAGISVSTMGSDLNSNFDKKNSVNREDSKDYIVSTLGKMSEDYRVMLDGGNAYTLKYASHILNIATDSSHYRYSSYPVPFVGMILHGYVSYAGAPLNYAGNAKYDALRSIESGAAPYYILAYEESNIKKLKEDENLSKYYGVSYTTWKDTVVENYKYINGAIGGLQDYQIVDHVVLVAERVLDEKEDLANFAAEEKLFFSAVKSAIETAVAKKLIEMKGAGKIGYGLKLEIDRAALTNFFFAEAQREKSGARYDAFVADFAAFCDAIEANYNGSTPNCADPAKHLDENTPCGCENKYETVAIASCTVDFSKYVTDSESTNKADYAKTNYTVDNGNVVMVTYKKGTDTVNFILNYNSYSVKVRMDNGQIITIGSYAFDDSYKAN